MAAHCSRQSWPWICFPFRMVGHRLFGLLFLLFLLIPVPSPAAGDEAKDAPPYSLAKSWFKPSLSVNNDPSVCTPLLEGYTHAFQTSEDNPLLGNIQGVRKS